MDNPRVTILIATYNDEEYLDGAIQSAFGQDYDGPLCICVIDDGSTDGSWDIIGSHFVNSATAIDQSDRPQTYSESNLGKSKNVTYIAIRQSNAGPSDARNTGIEKTLNNTDVYAVLDADDEMYENKVSTCVNVMKEHMTTIGAVYADYDTYHTDTEKIIREFKEPYSRRRLIEECIVHSGAIISKEALLLIKEDTGFYDKTMRTCEDYDLWMRISEKYIIAHVPTSLTLVRVTGDNSSFIVNKGVWEQNWSRVRKKLHDRTNVQK